MQTKQTLLKRYDLNIANINKNLKNVDEKKRYFKRV